MNLAVDKTEHKSSTDEPTIQHPMTLRRSLSFLMTRIVIGLHVGGVEHLNELANIRTSTRRKAPDLVNSMFVFRCLDVNDWMKQGIMSHAVNFKLKVIVIMCKINKLLAIQRQELLAKGV